jgi:hypothetical protein
MQPVWTLAHPRATHEMLGFIPSFLSENNPRGAVEQLDSAYKHGGGWHPFGGFELQRPIQWGVPTWRLKYPGDPAYLPLAYAFLREELIVLFEHAWVVVVQPDGNWVCAHMD